MAKHAKPTLTSTLSRNGARGAAAVTMASFGFLATAPAAFAGGGDGDYDHHHNKHGDVTHHESNDIDSHESQGIVNVADNDVLVPVQVCNNYVPVNVLGVQVPIEEINLAVPILTEGDTEADSSETCQQAGGIGDGDQAHKSGAASPALAPGSNDVGVEPDTGGQAAGGEDAAGLGDVQGLVGDNGGAPIPAGAVSPSGAERSAGEAMGLAPADPVGEQTTTPAPAPMGDLGMVDTPQATQAESLVPSGL